LISIARHQARLHYFGAKITDSSQAVPSLGHFEAGKPEFPLGTSIANDVN
jgi:hypothetical protein